LRSWASWYAALQQKHGEDLSMSEALWQSRTLVPPFARPELMIGAASPLWGFYTGVALAGMSWWWMSRWARPGGFERLAAATVEPAVAAVADAVGGPVVTQLVREQVPAAPVGGESAPIPAAAVEVEPRPEPAPATAAESAKPPEAAKAAEPAKEPELTAAPARARKPREAEPKAH
jgi:hypothetical protein